MTVAFERQELRILALKPIRELPCYSADHTAACRVGSALTAHMTGKRAANYGWALEKILSATVMRTKFPPL